jgi:hypothetical protein
MIADTKALTLAGFEKEEGRKEVMGQAGWWRGKLLQ